MKMLIYSKGSAFGFLHLFDFLHALSCLTLKRKIVFLQMKVKEFSVLPCVALLHLIGLSTVAPERA